MLLSIAYKSNYIGNKNLISIGVVELGSNDVDLSHFRGKHISCVHFTAINEKDNIHYS